MVRCSAGTTLRRGPKGFGRFALDIDDWKDELSPSQVSYIAAAFLVLWEGIYGEKMWVHLFPLIHKGTPYIIYHVTKGFWKSLEFWFLDLIGCQVQVERSDQNLRAGFVFL